jgi:deoxyxylulose-5-phosphate synthase
MKEKYYITTAIAYASTKPHFGNTYEVIMTDAVARYKRLRGYDVFFCTGTDEHGQKIELKAADAGITPKEYVDNVAGLGDLKAKWEVFGWTVLECDGHDFEAILETYAKAKECTGKEKPVMILMKTDMGKGVDFMAGTCEWHGKAPSEELAQKALAQLEETLGDY